MTPVKRQRTPTVPPSPPVNRTDHRHNMTTRGRPIYQGMEHNIKKLYRRHQPETIHQELNDVHLNHRNWNHNRQDQHISEETLALEEDDIDWDDQESGSEDDQHSEDQLRQMEDLGIDSWSEEDDDQTDTIQIPAKPVSPRHHQRHIPSISSIRVPRPTLAPKKPGRGSMHLNDVSINKITLSTPPTSSSLIPTRPELTHRDILVNDIDNIGFKVGDQVSLLKGPLTDTRKTGPDSDKSNHSIDTLITAPSITINEIFPIKEGQIPTEGPNSLPESSDLLDEIKSFLDPEKDFNEPDFNQLPNHTYSNTETITMTPSISHISDPPARQWYGWDNG